MFFSSVSVYILVIHGVWMGVVKEKAWLAGGAAVGRRVPGEVCLCGLVDLARQVFNCRRAMLSGCGVFPGGQDVCGIAKDHLRVKGFCVWGLKGP